MDQPRGYVSQPTIHGHMDEHNHLVLGNAPDVDATRIAVTVVRVDERSKTIYMRAERDD